MAVCSLSVILISLSLSLSLSLSIRLYGLYTMEVILATGFGHKVDVLYGEADELTKACGSVFAAAREGSALSEVTTLLSEFDVTSS